MTDLLSGRIDLSDFRGAGGGGRLLLVPMCRRALKAGPPPSVSTSGSRPQFQDFYNRPDTFTLGICNGCQLFGLLGWVPWYGIEAEHQPRFIHNLSGRFESRWSTVKILPSKAIMLQGMEDLVFGIHVDHGEGFLHFPDEAICERVWVKDGRSGLCRRRGPAHRILSIPTARPADSPVSVRPTAATWR